MCETFQTGANILFVRLVMDKHFFVLRLYPFICNIFNSVNILFAFRVNYSPPQIKNMCAPNYGDIRF